ncbi:hypothetical protein, partial [Mesorhizobium sp. M4A.F.Ca.ET.020.02.1.1]|uniref:hypothetical protein n=1 Tax=Mesorhizobium sp. M4A.F.Ca.ET.020.02.1.1 TaxID=2496652 RepID=UPI001AED04ED
RALRPTRDTLTGVVAAKGSSLIIVSVRALEETPKARSYAPPIILRRVSPKIPALQGYVVLATDRRSRSFTQESKERTWCSLN